ncbi:hypothetical protein BDW02DRAFT_578954 [Decorospora gaudefroyi]|uniref:Uncharacterized protein n=1 Tax=Decorospora gaudefroyi TaxID=184978 RepID=A0A6A5KGV5_9PLEO|nr:hypothetical protein BDW02DRAFT_578954 [Decorospora gaudefroyi]
MTRKRVVILGNWETLPRRLAAGGFVIRPTESVQDGQGSLGAQEQKLACRHAGGRQELLHRDMVDGCGRSKCSVAGGAWVATGARENLCKGRRRALVGEGRCEAAKRTSFARDPFAEAWCWARKERGELLPNAERHGELIPASALADSRAISSESGRGKSRWAMGDGRWAMGGASHCNNNQHHRLVAVPICCSSAAVSVSGAGDDDVARRTGRSQQNAAAGTVGSR